MKARREWGACVKINSGVIYAALYMYIRILSP